MPIFKLTPLLLLGATVIAFSSATPLLAAPGNELCPIMTEDPIDGEYTTKVGDVEVGLCCSACEKKWKANEKYYMKAGLEAGILPQFKGREAEFGLDKVELLPQRFCPITKKNIVTPDSPSTEYKGEKVYFYSNSGLRKWTADPDKVAKEATDAGLLPQLKGK
ncbi:hypothetical protein FEM03_08865 [Phragmitibacter flavus]|uniref:YHS domain-containing protein n=1 Tax=Phragmitibacter flavus TaxID=2576071 RepID=A0A5R8KFH0_9BACT|nr:hypothetical protein [Phragmitibacter flavus]TLD71017.1 hypothetical protein FEM03_08865 [Phragmitibacter flavus]